MRTEYTRRKIGRRWSVGWTAKNGRWVNTRSFSAEFEAALFQHKLTRGQT